MQGLSKTLSEIITDVSSDQRFKDPANKAKIIQEAETLAGLAHDLQKKSVAFPNQDPTLPIITGILARESKRAVIELKRDNRSYARSILKTIPGICMTCHTRNASGPQFASGAFEPTSPGLTQLEQAEFFVATRQFDRAQDIYKKVVESADEAKKNPFAWEKAVQQSLAIAVRVKQNPTEALAIASKVVKIVEAPTFTREDAQVWETSIRNWQKEPSRKAMSARGYMAEIARLMTEAKRMQKYPLDRKGDIYYLRASAVTHDLLQSFPKSPEADQALLMAGLSYEVLTPLKTDHLHEIYYEACIRRSPHTPLAESCYRRFEENIYYGYTGSAGTEIPEEVEDQLKQLRILAFPSSVIPPQ